MDAEIIEIPKYTKADFDTTAPFEFLYQYSCDPFMMERMTQKIKEMAQAAGVKSFMRLWEAYKKSNPIKHDEQAVANIATFENVPGDLQFEAGRYICNSSGVSYFDSFGMQHTICPHPIAPIKRFVNVDTNEEYLEIWYSKYRSENDVVSKTVVVSKADISKNITDLAKYGVVVNQQNSKLLSAYLMDIEQYNFGTIPEKKSVKRLGWVGHNSENFSPYVEDVYFDGEQDFGSMFKSVNTCGDYQTWVDAISKVRAEKTVVRYYLAASFASVILQPCGLLPFLVHTWGGTESGKTVSLMVAASVWANPELGEFVTTFNGTRYAQETKAAFLNNLPLCLDELQIQASQGVKDFDSIIYQLCEGVSKAQGKASGGLKAQLRWRNVILSNGEHTIIKSLSGGGARNRVLEIEAPGKAYSDLVGLCEIIKQNYGYAGRKFVEWLSVPENMDKVRATQKDFYHQLQEMDATDKQTASASAILTADKYATELIFQDGNALTVSDMRDILLTKDEVDVNARALDWLIDYVASNSNHFSQDSKNEIWGKVENLKYDDTGRTTHTIYFIRSVFNREMAASGLDARSFLSWASRKGLLTHDPGKYDTKRSIPGASGRPRCVVITLPDDGNSDAQEQSELIADTTLPF